MKEKRFNQSYDSKDQSSNQGEKSNAQRIQKGNTKIREIARLHSIKRGN